MAIVPSWQTAPAAWDRLKLGDDWLPGPVVVKLRDISSGLDVRKAPKTNKAALVDQGYEPIEATIELTIGFSPIDSTWASAAEQFTAWQRIMDKIRPKRAQKRTAIPISHPQFSMVGVGAVYVVRLSGLIGDGPGVRQVRIEVIEKAPIVAASAGTVQTGSGKGAPSLQTLKKAPDPAATETGP